jgi:hypothetical protein
MGRHVFEIRQAVVIPRHPIAVWDMMGYYLYSKLLRSGLSRHIGTGGTYLFQPPGAPGGFDAPSSQSQTKQNNNPFKNSPVCKALQAAADKHIAVAADLAGALGAGGALHVSLSADSVNLFVGGGFGGGGEVGVTVGPAFEHNTSSIFGLRTFATGGAGGGFGGAGTITAGTNGVSVNAGAGTVLGALAETGYGLDVNIPFSLLDHLCN